MFFKARLLLEAFSRKKSHHDEDESGKAGEVKLVRVLGLTDLTMLGVGATLGVGVYVLAGSVAKNQAGPAVIISFFIAAIASLFSALCYSEFASKVSKTGSAYNYTYLTVGEFAAFIIGWNLVLEYIIGTATEAKAIANSIDILLGNIYMDTVKKFLPMTSSFLASYPDFIAAAFVVVITSLLSWGVEESTKVNNIFTFFNLVTVGSIVFSGLFKVNLKNWNIKKQDIPKKYRGGNGGFMPFGINGIIAGAAKCFFGFVGFDGISTTGEEAKNPKRDIPLAIILSLVVVFFCYLGIAVVLTLILPYYEQNPDAPFPHIFDAMGWPIMKWAVTIGSLTALFTAMFGAFFPLPRILFSMSRDGLLYERFSYVSSITKTPLISTVVSGAFTAVMATIFNLEQLVDMMSIGTLLAYIIVATSVLLLRYCDESNMELSKSEEGNSSITHNEHETTILTKKESLYSVEVKKELDYLDASLRGMEGEEHQGVDNASQNTKHSSLKNGKATMLKEAEDYLRSLEQGGVRDERFGSEVNLNMENSHQESLIVRIFNLNDNAKMSPSSQAISKLSIYLLILMTVFVCFILNHLTYDKELERMKAEVYFQYENSNITDIPKLNHSVQYDMVSLLKSYDFKTNNKIHVVISRAIGLIPPERETSDVTQSIYHRNLNSELENAEETLNRFATHKIAIYLLVGAFYSLIFLILCRQPQFNDEKIKFKVPLVPLIPLLTIFMNLYLMLNLDVKTGVRFVIWLAVGAFIYFTYSIHHSKLKPPTSSDSAKPNI